MIFIIFILVLLCVCFQFIFFGLFSFSLLLAFSIYFFSTDFLIVIPLFCCNRSSVFGVFCHLPSVVKKFFVVFSLFQVLLFALLL